MKVQTPLAEAETVARRLAATLYEKADTFSRVEIAGSIRRQRPTVGDIELVAEVDPGRQFGDTARITRTLHDAGVRRAPGYARTDGVVVASPWGDRYMKGAWEFRPGSLVQVDLFVVRPPAEFGVVYLIRTGSAAFSQAVVTRLHRFDLRAQDGHVVTYSSGKGVPCPDEESFLRLARLPWIPPEQREMVDPATARLFSDQQVPP